MERGCDVIPVVFVEQLKAEHDELGCGIAKDAD